MRSWVTGSEATLQCAVKLAVNSLRNFPTATGEMISTFERSLTLREISAILWACGDLMLRTRQKHCSVVVPAICIIVIIPLRHQFKMRTYYSWDCCPRTACRGDGALFFHVVSSSPDAWNRAAVLYGTWYFVTSLGDRIYGHFHDERARKHRDSTQGLKTKCI